VGALTALVYAGIEENLIFRDGFENRPPVITSSAVTAAGLDFPYSYDPPFWLFKFICFRGNTPVGAISGKREEKGVGPAKVTDIQNQLACFAVSHR
jgi:hypothetical protein